MKMEDFKNRFKVVSVLLLGMAWFFFEFHLSDTDANKKKQLIETELPKECDFRIETCEEYRGFNFMGKNKFNETNFCKFSSSWDLDQKYHIGDRIVKKKGSLEILLIRQDIDTIKAHLYFKGDEILEEKRVRHINTFIQEHPEALKITSGANNVIYKEKEE